MPIFSLQALLPRTVKVRLALIFMLATSVLTSGFGAWSYYLTELSLIVQRDEFKVSLARRMGQPASLAMWTLDPAAARAILDSELAGLVQGLALYDERGDLWVQRGSPLAASAVKKSDGVEVFSINMPKVANKDVGRIEVTWSDAQFKHALRQTLWLTLAQGIGMNLVLLGLFWVGVDKLIFSRVRTLQRALDHAASRDEAADIVALTETQRDEFGAITQSINSITHRLGCELEAGRESEEEARAALSNLQNAQEGLVRAEKMAALGSLVAGVSHELNTPIGNIVMVASTQQEMLKNLTQSIAAGTMKRSTLDMYLTQAKEGADLLLHSASRAAELVQNFKQVAVDQSSERLRNFDLAHQITEVLSVIAHITSKTKITIALELQPNVAMQSYPGPLGQVMTNLVMNAITHGFEALKPGTITITSSCVGDKAKIIVTDNGMGISAENIGKIFDPFFTTKLGQGGSGLGLHICHNIVFGPLGGRLTVHSVVGQGTTFTIVMPCRAPRPP